MSSTLELTIHSSKQHVQAVLADRGMVLLGKEGCWSCAQPPADGLRGPWIELVPRADGTWRTRCSKGVALDTFSEPTDVLPLRFAMEEAYFEVVDTAQATEPRCRPLEILSAANTEDPRRMPHAQGPDAATLSRWFDAISTLNRGAVGTDEFLQAATALVIDSLGFDGAYLVRRDASEKGWSVVSANLPHPELGVGLDTSLLDRLLEVPEVHFHGKTNEPQEGPAFAFAPWLDADQRVVGAVVGVRHLHTENGRQGVRHLEANLLRLLADSLSTEQARHDQLERCARRRALLQQVFTPTLAERIEQEPEVLDGRRREVTILFADLRDSSQLFHTNPNGQPGPAETYRLLSDVMDTLTGAVIEQDGVIIDYYGDGLSAMWNAPFDQPNHVERACRAALIMVERLRCVSVQWDAGIGLHLGVGIHMGIAQVGNIGSRWKLKYGARGAAVNLASRLEGSTKTVGVPIVVSSSIARNLPVDLTADHLCRASLKGIEGPTDLYRLAASGDTFDAVRYAVALDCYEQGRLDEAVLLIDEAICQQGNEHAPFTFLRERVQHAIQSQPARRLGDTNPDLRNRVICVP